MVGGDQSNCLGHRIENSVASGQQVKKLAKLLKGRELIILHEHNTYLLLAAWLAAALLLRARVEVSGAERESESAVVACAVRYKSTRVLTAEFLRQARFLCLTTNAQELAGMAPLSAKDFRIANVATFPAPRMALSSQWS